MAIRAVPPAGEPQPRRRVIVQTSLEFGVDKFDVTDDREVTLWIGGEMVGWFDAGVAQAVYFADARAAASAQAG